MPETTEVLQNLFDNVPLMICFTDHAGHVRFANREFQRVVGWSLEKIRNTPDFVAELCPDPDYRADMMEFIRTANGTFAEFRIRIRGGPPPRVAMPRKPSTGHTRRGTTAARRSLSSRMSLRCDG